MSNNLLKFIIGIELVKMITPIPIERLFERFYLGKFKVRVLESVSNKSYVCFLEKGIVGNKKIGYRIVEKGEALFVYTRCCWNHRRVELS